VSRKTRKKGARKRASKTETPRPRVPLADAPYKAPVPLEYVDGVRWRVPQRGAMRTDGLVFADESLLPDLRADRALEQVANVATLPGIVGSSLAMPDIHMGYGFPIGGVAAFDEHEGVVSPGGVGYDINCGVRLLASDLGLDAVRNRIAPLIDGLFDAIPAGVGSRRQSLGLREGDLDELMADGLQWAERKGLAEPEDRVHVEDGGCIAGAQPHRVSDRAKQRGMPQLGTLGSGNHFAEVGVVDAIYDEPAAAAFGLREGLVTVMIHSGSRGLGHQVCTDSLTEALQASVEHGIPLVDRQLCCMPVGSGPARRYLGAMAAAANFAFVNRQVMTHFAREVVDDLFGGTLRTVYDVCHNIAKWEEHDVDGVSRRLLVHRKGATRSLPPGHTLVPDAYRAIGQPVIIPGDMGRYSFVLRGASGSAVSFGSACHGAGRVLSRSEARRRFGKDDVRRAMDVHNVLVRGASRATVLEELPQVYKDVADVVDVVGAGGLASKVARIRPLGTIKG
jgi:tRNA-splicing ligase RtcB (3'-phosphate/5'-hydroxy nucleic acid ligase)